MYVRMYVCMFISYCRHLLWYWQYWIDLGKGLSSSTPTTCVHTYVFIFMYLMYSHDHFRTSWFSNV